MNTISGSLFLMIHYDRKEEEEMKRENMKTALRIGFVVTLLLVLFVMMGASASATAGPSGFNYDNAKFETLLFSQCTTSDHITLRTDFNWNSFANSAANGIVIIPSKNVNGADYWDIGHNGLSQYTTLATVMGNVIKKLQYYNPNVKIWFGLPGISSTCYSLATSSNCLTTFTNYITAVKNNVGTTIWNNNVKGVYYNQESIYGTVNYNALTSNDQILLMNNIAYRIHANFVKDTLWIPYYGYGANAAEIIKRIGYVTNRTAIFNCVILQAGYMSHHDSESLSNFNGICASVNNNTVCYRNGTPVCTRSASATAQVGAEIELNTYYPEYYSPYLNYYMGFVDNSPLAFYWQGNLTTAISYIYGFYNMYF